ncbi:MAG TPA: hypothetical protein VFX44_09615 [Solirubrobacterales bacterium]|nr:hypothetical protein [Solirubrobacterales bacterium]
MTRTKARRPRLGMIWFALALGALVAFLAMPSLAAAKDRNHDHIPDRWEKKNHLSTKVNQARRDQDRDHLNNRQEFLAGDNPHSKDSNHDGVMDGEENAGTIASFDEETGKLTINLFGGETLSGFVTEETEIQCDDHSGAGASASSEDNSGEEESEPGDDNGGEEEVDDNGGQGEEEPGDDNGGEESDNSGPGNGGEEHGNCTTAALTPGAVVQEAELKVESGKATFEKVELSGKEA